MNQLDNETIKSVQDAAKEKLYSPGDILIQQGNPGDSLCVIARGTVRVYRTIAGIDRFLDLMGPGSVIGEMGVLTKNKRSATVKAETPGKRTMDFRKHSLGDHEGLK